MLLGPDSTDSEEPDLRVAPVEAPLEVDLECFPTPMPEFYL